MQLLERLQAEYGEQFEKDKKGFEFDNEVNQSIKKPLKAELDKATKQPFIDKEKLSVLRGNFMELEEEPEAVRDDCYPSTVKQDSVLRKLFWCCTSL